MAYGKLLKAYLIDDLALYSEQQKIYLLTYSKQLNLYLQTLKTSCSIFGVT